MDIPEPVETGKKFTKWVLLVSLIPRLVWPLGVLMLILMAGIPHDSWLAIAWIILGLGAVIEVLVWRDREKKAGAARAGTTQWLKERQEEYEVVSSALVDVASSLPPGSAIEKLKPAQDALTRARKSLAVSDAKVVQVVIQKLKKSPQKP